MDNQPAPRRFWHITFFTADGTERRRYIKCPYLVPTDEAHGGKDYRRPLVAGDQDYPDTMLAMSATLSALEWDGVVTSFRISPVPSERIAAIRGRAVRWTEVYASLIAA